jgi:hypothetical protein
MLVHFILPRVRPISGPIDSRDVISCFTSFPNDPLCKAPLGGLELSPSDTKVDVHSYIMCGIIAVFERQSASGCTSDELSAQIQDSLGYIAHRGPDASAVWVNEDASCGELSAVWPKTS